MPHVGDLLRELRRRSVFRVAIVYAAVGWVLIQASSIVVPALHLPAWVTTFVVVVVALGFPLALILAWAFEVTPQGVRRTSEDEDAGVEPSAPGGKGRRRRVFAVSALVLLLVVVVGWGVWRSLRTDDGTTSAARIAVLPFAIEGSGEVAYLGDGMVNLLGTKLDGAGDLRSVDPRALLSHVRREGKEALGPEDGRAVAHRFGAGLYVMGDIVGVGDRLTIHSALYDVRRGEEPLGTATVEGETARVFDLVDRLAAQLLASISGGSGARVSQIAAVTTSSLPALKAYLEGDAALRVGDYERAVEALQRAVAQDTTFALGYYRLSLAAEWLLRADLAHSAAAQAFRHADRLADRDRRLLEAFYAYRSGRYVEAENLYRSILGTYPSDVEAWFFLGEVLFHTNPLRGKYFVESREPFERVLAFEPDNAIAFVHLARIAAFERRLPDLDVIVDRYVASNPAGDRLQPMLSLRAFASGNRAEQARIFSSLEQGGESTIALAVWDVAIYVRDVDSAERLARLLAEPWRSPEARSTGHGYLAHLALARGRWSEARRELDAMEAIDPAGSLEFRALLSSLPFVPLDRPALEGLRERLRAFDASAVPATGNPSTFFSAHNGVHPLLHMYLIGLLSARLGDEQAAEEAARRLPDIEVPPQTGSLRSDLASSIRAQARLASGDEGAALAGLEETKLDAWYEITIASPFHSEALERFLRAQLLQSAGRDREALVWYDNLLATSVYETPYLGVTLLRRGEIYERMGDRQRAVEHYRRFIDLWRDCDLEFVPLRQEAEAALARLGGTARAADE